MYGIREMISALQGTAYKEMPPILEITVEGGVSYEVTVPRSAWDGVECEEFIWLAIHHHITEDSEALYGFKSRALKKLFRTLLKVNGVGPALAMNLVEKLGGDLPAAIANGDVKALRSVKGVGEKTANQIILDLKKRFEGATDEGRSPIAVEVEEALGVMGYSQGEIKDALAHIKSKGIEDVEAAIGVAIGFLSSN